MVRTGAANHRYRAQPPSKLTPLPGAPSPYLADALTEHVLPHLDEKKQARVKELQQWLRLTDTPAADRQVYQAQFDNLIAAECPLTGSIMIDSIDRPLVSPEQLEAEAATWEI